MTYLFENYSLDAGRRELRAGSELVPVEPLVFDLLQFLISNRERVVSKDDLFAGVWNGRIVSESTLSSRITAARHAIGDSGEAQRLIRTVARKGFRFVGTVQIEARQAQDRSATNSYGRENSEAFQFKDAARTLSDRPSIAVLPFANFSADPDQEYFVDGIIEDVINALSQFRWLFVIARSSSFIYKGRALDIKAIGHELGVRYVLDGSVRKAAHRVRITAELIDTATGAHLWGNRFDGGLEDIFHLQDQITASVVSAIAPKLEQVEIERAKRKSTEIPGAYDYYLRGMGNLYLWTRESIAEALRLFCKAVETDPAFASAYGMAAYCYVQRKSQGWFTDRQQEISAASRFSRQAAELGRDDAIALSKAAHTLSYVVGDVDSSVALIDQALAVNPNLASAWYVSGWVRIFLGDPEHAIEHLTHAAQLSPFDPLIFHVHAGIGYALFFAGRHSDAARWLEKALSVAPDYLTALRGAAASYAVMRRLEDARKLMNHMRKLDPALRLSNLKELLPLRRQEHYTKWSEALREAGLPE